MSKIQSLFDEYTESHQNSVNKFIHWVCVPIIFWSISALFWSVKFPIYNYTINLFLIFIIPLLIYYFIMSWRLTLSIAMFLGFCININWFLEKNITIIPLWKLALILFFLAWVGQFIGHHIEGKKPSFFKDLQFLLIGPVWLIHFIYKSLGLKY